MLKNVTQENGYIEIVIGLLHKTEDGGGKFSNYLEMDKMYNSYSIIDLLNEWNETHHIKITHDLDNTDIGCAYMASATEAECGLRISADGKVFPCQMFTDDRFSIGDIYTESLIEILNGDVLKSFINKIHKRRNEIKKYKVCAYKAMCAAGCPANAYIIIHTLSSVSGNG